MKDANITAIVEEAINGDKTALIKICERKCRDILFLSMHLMGNKEDGEDAAQEAMIYMQQHIKNLRNAEAFGVWMYRVVSNICKQMRRKMKYKNREQLEEKEYEIAEDRREFLPYEYAEDGQKRELLLQSLDKLPYDCKACIILFYYEQMSYSEIAEVLRVSKKKVDHTLTKAKRLLVRDIEQKTGAKALLQNVSGMVPIPVMTQALNMQAQTLVTPQAIGSLIDIAAKGTIGAAGAGSGIAAGVSGAAKITISLAIGAAAVTGGVLMGNQQQIQEMPEPTPIVIEERVEPTVQAIPTLEMTEPVAEAVMLIETLEEMIGEENATRLRGYAQQESDPQELEAFLLEIGLEPDLYLTTMEAKDQYTSYYLVKQNKMLMVIRKNGGISFLLAEANEPYLQDGQLIVNYEKWK